MVASRWPRWRSLFAALAVSTVLVSGSQSAFADKKTNPNEREIAGTVYSHNDEKKTIVLITDDFGVRNQPITLDFDDFKNTFRALDDGQAVSLLVLPRDHDSYLVTGLVSEGSYVHREDLGTQERYEVRDSSIKAHVGNVPEDDESLNQQHRDNNLRRNEDDDHDNAPDSSD